MEKRKTQVSGPNFRVFFYPLLFLYMLSTTVNLFSFFLFKVCAPQQNSLILMLLYMIAFFFLVHIYLEHSNAICFVSEEGRACLCPQYKRE